MAQLYQAILYPLQSFTDRHDQVQNQLFRRQVVQVFPYQQAENQKVYKMLIEKLKEIPFFSPDEKIKMETVEGATVTATSSLTLKNVLDTLKTHVSRTAQKRLEHALEYAPQPGNDQERAQKLQTILCLLEQERNLVKRMCRETQAARYANPAAQQVRHDAEKTIRIHPFLEIFQFNCPSEVKDSEEWALRLQVVGIVDQVLENVQPLLNAPNKEDKFRFRKLGRLFSEIEKLKKLGNSKLEWLLTKCDEIFKCEISLVYLVRFQLEGIQQIQKTEKSPLITERKRWLSVEDVVAPYGGVLIHSCREFLNKTKFSLSQNKVSKDLDMPYYESQEKFCLAYTELAQQQEALYHLLIKR